MGRRFIRALATALTGFQERFWNADRVLRLPDGDRGMRLKCAGCAGNPEAPLGWMDVC